MRNILILEGPFCPVRKVEMQWPVEQLSPFTTYPAPSESKSLFTEFLLKPVQLRSGKYICGLGASLTPAHPADWAEWTDELLGNDRWLDSLGRLSQLQPEPFRVWIMLPYPVYWMYIDTKERIDAVKVWIEEFTSRFASSPAATSLQLSGFIWGRESVHENDIPVVQGINDVIHSMQLRSLWLPNYSGARVQEWSGLGFDEAALFSNYTGSGPITKDWVRNACKSALVHQFGLQMVYGIGKRFRAGHIETYKEWITHYIRSGGAGPIIHRCFYLKPQEMMSVLPIMGNILRFMK
ncbi:DUF4855 domain-containing protein [Marinicrinis lubricantis]|uniref:DUF4855 domain-containing protein n=1 Tax=Marinicrinis lubricantis TaxID=2086470 RepID=A0ABW1IKX8_9BACL